MSLLAEKYKKKDLAVLAVNVRSTETEDAVRDFAEAQNLKLTFLQAGEGVAMEYEVTRVPTTIFIDVTGAIDAKLEGFNPAKMESFIEGILPP